MKLNEKINFQDVAAKIPELHGHTKITLTDIDTGEEKIIESDNIVTNAVKNFFQNPYLSNMIIENVLPVNNFFSGVLCFDSEIEEDADAYGVPSSNAAVLTAYAGDAAHTTADPLKGNPNAIESGEVLNGKGYKFVWDFGTSQGNGTISTVCLTNKWLGNNGLFPWGPDNWVEHPLNWLDLHRPSAAYHVDATTENGWDRASAIRSPIFYDNETSEGIALYLGNESQSDTLEIIRVGYDSTKFGLNKAANEFRELSSETVTLPAALNLTKTIAYVDDENFYFVSYSTSHQFSLTTVNRTTHESTKKLVNVPSTLTIANFTYAKYFSVHSLYPVVNGKIYVRGNGSSDGLIIYDIESEDVTNIPGSLDSGYYSHMAPIVISEDYIIGANYLVYGDGLYSLPNSYVNFLSITGTPARNTLAEYQVFDSIFNGFAINLTNTTQGQRKYYGQNCPVFNPFFLSTINVLDTPVTKTASQTMKIEYTISEV